MYPRRDEPRPRALRAAAIVLHAPMMVSGAHEPTRAPALNLSVDRVCHLSTPSPFLLFSSHSPLTRPTAYISHPISPPRPPRVSPAFAQPPPCSSLSSPQPSSSPRPLRRHRRSTTRRACRSSGTAPSGDPSAPRSARSWPSRSTRRASTTSCG